MTPLIRRWLVVAATAAISCSSAEQTASYPSRPVDIVVPFPPGGGSDNLARTIQDIVGRSKLSEQPVTVSNRSGGSGAVGLAYVAARKGDGYTLVTLNDPLVSLGVQPHYTGPTLQDLTLVAILALDEMAIVVPANSRFKTIEEVIAFARANPGKLTFSTESQGGGDHVLGILIERATGASFTYVHTRGGAEAMQNLVGGHVDLAGPNPSEMLSQWKGGLARPLVVSAPERVAIMPDVPTLKERGIDVVHRMMRGVALPGDAPAESLRYWEAALAKVTESDGWRRHYLERFALTPYFKTGDDARAFLARHEALNRDALNPATETR
jgi:putative tricarboxylic transport membrane protein